MPLPGRISRLVPPRGIVGAIWRMIDLPSTALTGTTPIMRIPSTLIAAMLCAAAANTAKLGAQSPPASQSDPRVIVADSLFLARDYTGATKQYAAAAVALDNRSRLRYAVSLASIGDFTKAAPILDSLAPNGNPLVLYNAGSVHASLGHADTAFAYLNMSMTAGFSNGQVLASDSGFAKLKSDPRHAAATKRLKDAFTPCVNNPESHKFDFWVGEWEVTGVSGQRAGSSSVQKILADCVVLENWTAQGGGTGKSFNAFNRALNRWQQFWVDQFGNVTEYRDSEWVGTSLQYMAKTTRQGAEVLQRMTFTPIDSNTVRQLGETSTDGGKTWTTGYDLTYRRKK